MFVSGSTGPYAVSLKMHNTLQAAETTAVNGPARIVNPLCENSRATSSCSAVDLGKCIRIALMVTPESRGSFDSQVKEALGRIHAVVDASEIPLSITSQTVFLRDPEDEVRCHKLLEACFGDKKPLTTFVYQAPCNGAALALEAWAVGGADLQIERFGPHAISVSYDSLRWVFCGGITEGPEDKGVYAQTHAVLGKMEEVLRKAGSNFENAVRTWFYLGGITEPEADTQRYKELNRARSDFYHPLSFHKNMVEKVAEGVYPASTGIGMQGMGIAAGCLTLQTSRSDVRLLALENPRQTPAYAYHPRYSPQSPKFSRAMALVTESYVTTWVSGTASIVDSESLHLADPVGQTEQTIDNIERLVARENMAFHGITGAGATLQDLAKIRVYVKRAEDYETVRAICQRRFGNVPAIYAVADVCRPELLVEIEGVAFCRRM